MWRHYSHMLLSSDNNVLFEYVINCFIISGLEKRATLQLIAKTVRNGLIYGKRDCHNVPE